jgi:hypothetical protein
MKGKGSKNFVVDAFLTSRSKILRRDDDDLQNVKIMSELDERLETLRLRRVCKGNGDVNNRQNSHRKTVEEVGMSRSGQAEGMLETPRCVERGCRA